DPQSGSAKEMAIATSDFAFAPDGALAALGPPPPRGGDRPLLIDGVRVATATAFAFSPDGRELALLSTGKQPGEATGDLHRLTRSSGASHLVATRVADWRWGGAGDLLCLARYDVRARAGTLRCAGGPRSCSLLRAPFAGGAPEVLAANVSGFDLSRDGKRILLQQPHHGAARAVDLAVLSADGAAPGQVKSLVEEVDPSSRFAD